MKLFLLALLPWIGLQEKGDAERERAELAKIKLDLFIGGKSFDPIELAPVTVRFTNASKENLTLRLNPRLPARALLHIEDPRGGTYFPEDFGMRGSTQAKRVDLAPGQFTESTTFISMKFLRGLGTTPRRGFSDPAEGAWKIRAEHGYGAGKVESIPKEFQVKADPTIPARSREMLGLEEWHRFAMNGWPRGSELDRFREFVLSDQDASQKDIMAYLVGVHELYRLRFEQAETMLRAAEKGRARSMSPRLVSWTLVQCLFRFGRYGEALKFVDSVEFDPLDIKHPEYEDLKSRILKLKRD